MRRKKNNPEFTYQLPKPTKRRPTCSSDAKRCEVNEQSVDCQAVTHQPDNICDIRPCSLSRPSATGTLDDFVENSSHSLTDSVHSKFLGYFSLPV